MHFQFTCIIRSPSTRPLLLVKIMRIVFEFLWYLLLVKNTLHYYILLSYTTLTNVDRISNSFHCWTQKQMCNKNDNLLLYCTPRANRFCKLAPIVCMPGGGALFCSSLASFLFKSLRKNIVETKTNKSQKLNLLQTPLSFAPVNSIKFVRCLNSNTIYSTDSLVEPISTTYIHTYS